MKQFDVHEHENARNIFVVTTRNSTDGDEEVAHVVVFKPDREGKSILGQMIPSDEVVEFIKAQFEFDTDMRRWKILHKQEGWGSSGSFGLQILAYDSERDLSKKADWADKKEHELSMQSKALYEAERILIQGIRGQTAITKPDFEEKRQKEKDYFKEIFKTAGLGPIYMRALPNGYCKEYCCLHIPWFEVTCAFGVVEIGWRKRVINIDWSKTEITKSGEDLFPEENVTRGGGYGDDTQYIHAWGEDKAVAYLKVLFEEWKKTQPETSTPLLAATNP